MARLLPGMSPGIRSSSDWQQCEQVREWRFTKPKKKIVFVAPSCRERGPPSEISISGSQCISGTNQGQETASLGWTGRCGWEARFQLLDVPQWPLPSTFVLPGQIGEYIDHLSNHEDARVEWTLCDYVLLAGVVDGGAQNAALQVQRPLVG
eukprot:s5193_g4.t1